jgi:uracil-DNA glycosylase family 4
MIVRRSLLGSGRRAKVLWWGESPGDDEARKGMAFVGKAGQLLRRIIAAPEMPKGRHVLDNVCPKHLGRDTSGEYTKPTAADLNEFADYRRKVIERWNPEVMVLLGKFAFQAFGVRLKTGVVNRCGEIVNVGGRPTVLSVHPSYICRRPSEMDRMVTVVKSIVASAKKRKKSKFQWIDRESRGNWLLKECWGANCGFDIEASSLEPKEATPLVMSVSPSSLSADTFVLPIYHPEADWKLGEKLLKLVSAWWPKGPRVVQNCMYEVAVMREVAKRFKRVPKDPKVLFDTMLASWMHNELEPQNLNHQVTTKLHRAAYWLNIPDPKITPFAEVPLRDLGEYNANDAYCTYLLKDWYEEHLDESRLRLLTEMWTPLAIEGLNMRERGVRCDPGILQSVFKKIQTKERSLQRKVKKDFPGVNPRSHKQMQALLFDQMKLPVIERSKKTRAPSAGAEVLKRLAIDEPKIKPLAELRKIQSLQSRIKDWPEYAVDGFLHPHWQVGRTVTGRFSTVDPNILNPDREARPGEYEEKGIQRQALVSRYKRGKIVTCDYAQHELRLYAAIAGDLLFLDGWRKNPNFDPHQQTCDLLRKDGVDVNRDRSKNCNFAVIYGVGPGGLWKNYAVPKRLGAQMINTFQEVHHWLPAYHKNCERQVRDFGYVEALTGQRKHVRDRFNGHEVRAAYNFPIQYFAAFICFQAMLEIRDWLWEKKLKSLIVMQTHDSIGFDCPAGEVKHVSSNARKMMLGVDYRKYVLPGKLEYDIPLGVDVKVGEHL